MLDFDTMLCHVGEFGLYQKILFTFQAPFCIFVTFVLFGQVFMVLYPQNYWCEEHFACLEIDSEVNAPQRRNISLRWINGGLFTSDPCETNEIHDPFLKQLHRWDKRYCDANNASADCFLNVTANEKFESSSRPSRRPTWPEPPPRLELPDENDKLLRRRRQYGGYGSSTPWKKPSTFGTTEKTFPAFGSPEWGDNPVDKSINDKEGRRQGYGNGGGSWPSGGNYGTERPESGQGTNRYPGSTQNGYPRPETYPGSSANKYAPKPWPTTTTSRYGGGGESDYETDYSSTNRPNQPTSEKQGSSQEKINYKRYPKFKDFKPSSRQQTPLNSAHAGWPVPKCKQGQRFTMSLRARTSILAETMMKKFRNNNSYGRIEDCRVRWNRSEVPYETIVTEGDWWCNAEAFITISQAVFFLGAIVGGFLIGWIADTFGRVPALVIANVLGALGGALSAVSTNVWIFSAFRFITGMAFDNSMTMMYILVLEFCGPSYRTLVANLSIAIFYTFGTILLPILAFYIGNWRIYALVISLPMLLALLALFFVPESARWLLSKGRTKQAVNILRNFAKVNRKKVDEQIFVDFEHEATKLFAQLEDEEEEPSLTAAFSTPRLRRTFILLTIFWSLIALVYDGHSRNIINLADEQLNVFWMFGIASMTEFPADILLIFTLDRFGRRWLAFGAMTLSGAFSIIAAAITPQMRVGFLIAAIISRFWVNVAFNIGLQYAAELLPTVIRAQGVNAIHIMGYVASIISPFVAAIGRTNPTLSLILLGAFSVVAGCSALFLAETLGEDLPNTLEEAEAFGKNQSFWNCPICAKEREEEYPIHPPPSAVEERPVVLRNALRGSIRGETYRSSMISQASSGGSRRSRYLNPGGGGKVMQSPDPTELTRLRRITH